MSDIITPFIKILNEYEIEYSKIHKIKSKDIDFSCSYSINKYSDILEADGNYQVSLSNLLSKTNNLVDEIKLMSDSNFEDKKIHRKNIRDIVKSFYDINCDIESKLSLYAQEVNLYLANRIIDNRNPQK